VEKMKIYLGPPENADPKETMAFYIGQFFIGGREGTREEMIAELQEKAEHNKNLEQALGEFDNMLEFLVRKGRIEFDPQRKLYIA
jgi:hypothetical protein